GFGLRAAGPERRGGRLLPPRLGRRRRRLPAGGGRPSATPGRRGLDRVENSALEVTMDDGRWTKRGDKPIVHRLSSFGFSTHVELTSRGRNQRIASTSASSAAVIESSVP